MRNGFNAAFGEVSQGGSSWRSAAAINMQRAAGRYAGAYRGSDHDQAYVTAGTSGGLAGPLSEGPSR